MTDLGLDRRDQLNTPEPPFGNSAYSGITERTHRFPELAPPDTVLVDLRRETLIEIVDSVVGGTRPIGGFRAGSNKGFDTDHIEERRFLGVRVTECPPLNGATRNERTEVPLIHDEPGETALTWLSPDQLWTRVLAPDGLRPILYGTRQQASYAETIQTGESCELSGWIDPHRDPGNQVRPFDEFADAWPGLESPFQAVAPETELRAYPDLDLEFDWSAAPSPESFNVRFIQQSGSQSDSPHVSDRSQTSPPSGTPSPQITASPVPGDVRADVHISDPFTNRFDTRRALIASPYECKRFISAGRDVSRAPDLDWDVAHPRFVREMADELVFENPGMDLADVTEFSPWEYVTTTAEVIHMGPLNQVPGTTSDSSSAVVDVVLHDGTDSIRATLWGGHATDVAQSGPGTHVSVEGETRPADDADTTQSVTLSIDHLSIVEDPADRSSSAGYLSTDVDKWAVDVRGPTETVAARTGYRLSLSAVIDHLTTNWGPVTISGPLFEEVAHTTYRYTPAGPIGDPSLTPSRSQNPDPSAASKMQTTGTAGGLFFAPDAGSLPTDTSSSTTGQAVRFNPDEPATFAALASHLSEQHTLTVPQSHTNPLEESLPRATSTHWVPDTRLPSGTLYSFSNTQNGATLRIEAELPTDDPDANSWGGEARIDHNYKERLAADDTAQAAYRIVVDEPWEDYTECVASFPREHTAVETTITHMIALTHDN